MRLLRLLEAHWPQPQTLGAYRSVLSRLSHESPLFQRLQWSSLPPVKELLLSSVPAWTLVITIQTHNSHVYIGAACTPGEPEPPAKGGKNAEPPPPPPEMRYWVGRVALNQCDLHRCMVRLQEVNLGIEKEMLHTGKLNEALADQYQQLLKEAEDAILKPILPELVAKFCPEADPATGVVPPGMPKQILLLPDSLLWPLPFEHFESLSTLLAAPGPAAFARDLSLHSLAFRSRTPPPTTRPASSALLTDAFNEDQLRSEDDPKSETMCSAHKRLVEAKIISNADKSLNGQLLAASPEDIKGILTDVTMFFALGLGKFFSTINATHFASMDLRHVKLLGIFHRGQNDQSFRRQTKTDSMKTVQQLAMENAYGVALIATFRGAQCVVSAGVPVPVPLQLRAFDAFVRGIQGLKSTAKSLEDVFALQVDHPDQRYVRVQEAAGAADGKKGKEAPKDAKKPGQGQEEPSTKEDLLPKHTQDAYIAVGLAWAASDAAEAAGGKKK